MKTAPAFELVSSGLTVSERNLELQWIEAFLSSYESKDLVTMMSFYGTNASLEMQGLPTVTSIEALSKCFTWLYAGVGEGNLEIVLKTACVFQQHIVLKVENVMPSGVHFVLDLFVCKSREDHHANSLTVTGEMTKMVEIFESNAGPFPTF